MLKIEDLTIGQAREIAALVGGVTTPKRTEVHPMLNRRVLVRTYSAGVHIGDAVFIDGTEVHLKNSLRLWNWEGGGLSLSAVANNGVVKARLNRTGEVYLTNAIEFIPTTEAAEITFEKFIEN